MHVTIAALHGVTVWLAFILFACLYEMVDIGLAVAVGPVVVSSSTILTLAIDALIAKVRA